MPFSFFLILTYNLYPAANITQGDAMLHNAAMIHMQAYMYNPIIVYFELTVLEGGMGKKKIQFLNVYHSNTAHMHAYPQRH